jgi:hypothetical protein
VSLGQSSHAKKVKEKKGQTKGKGDGDEIDGMSWTHHYYSSSYMTCCLSESTTFQITLVVNMNDSHDFLKIESNILWLELLDKIAKLLNVHPDSVQTQWQLSSEPQHTLSENL